MFYISNYIVYALLFTIIVLLLYKCNAISSLDWELEALCWC